MTVTCNGLSEIVKYFVESTAADVNSLDNVCKNLMVNTCTQHTLLHQVHVMCHAL